MAATMVRRCATWWMAGAVGVCVVLEVTPARARVAESLDGGAPDIVHLPAPGAPVEFVYLRGGYRARVLALFGDAAVILVAPRPSRT